MIYKFYKKLIVISLILLNLLYHNINSWSWYSGGKGVGLIKLKKVPHSNFIQTCIEKHIPWNNYLKLFSQYSAMIHIRLYLLSTEGNVGMKASYLFFIKKFVGQWPVPVHCAVIMKIWSKYDSFIMIKDTYCMTALPAVVKDTGI